jgi:hypothetical protein
LDVDKARDYLDCACTLVSLAVEHIDLAVAVISSFLDPKEVASVSEFADRAAYISEVRALPCFAATILREFVHYVADLSIDAYPAIVLQ